jgi:exodeoxyribonuclease V gamma subunit
VLRVHRSERADTLVSMLGDLLIEPLEDPMTPEVVSVPTRGIERWLTQRLSARLGASAGGEDGVCANIDFPFPGTLVNSALALAAGADPDVDPWLPQRAVWPLMEVVEEHFDEEWVGPLAVHMTKSGTTQERFGSIRHVADLFDRYAVHRPDMLQRWAEGVRRDGETLWQYELWRRLRDRIGRPSPAERLLDATTRLREEPELLDVPGRLSLFGLTRLPASHLDVLEAMAECRAVHLFLLHPSPALWGRLEPRVGPLSRHVLRRDDPTASAPRNPLLASWGRDAREMQLVLGGAVPHEHEPEPVAPTGPRTLLELIQDDIRADRAPGGAGGTQDDDRPSLEGADDSIRVHSCHGRGRQVEVLRDAVLHLLEEDETLEARDVIVMCPDIESFAPLIEATFGAHDATEGFDRPPHRLEIRLADRSLRQTNPVMGVLAELLDLAPARLTATQVLDLAGREPVRRRFRFSDDDLSRLEQWVREAHVHWGFDQEHREAFGLGSIGANTWRSGLDRILLGVAMADEGQRLFGGALPLDDVENGDIDLAGRLTEFVERLRRAIDALAGSRALNEWAATLARISDSLTATSSRDAWQQAQLTTLLDDLVDEATAGWRVSPVVLGRDDIRSILADRLKGRPTRANFRTGHLTVCTLVPMRSIPHRVVCLLGLDDGSFPRHIERDGDDLSAQDPRVGDRDVRSEDRQLLLDALLAAREHLVITYTGRDERSNLSRPPAVPVGELLDVVDRTVQTDDGPASQAVIVRHPLQPFDPRNYEPGRLAPGGPWSFDELHLAGARAVVAPRHDAPEFLERPLPDPVGGEGPVEIDDLDRFVRHPVRVFLRERLGVSLWDRTRDFEDAIPIDLDGLAEWEIGERVLRACLSGDDWTACEAAEKARGALPPSSLADPLLDEMAYSVEALVSASRDAVGGAPASLDVRVDPGGLAEVVGAVSGVHGNVIHDVTYRRMQPSLRLAAWVRLLALSAAYPDRPFEAVTIGRAERRSSRVVSLSRIGPLGPDPQTRKRVADAQLRSIVDLYRRGMREPLPLYCKTSAAYAAARRSGADDADVPALGEWESNRDFKRENRENEHLLVLGGDLSFVEMVARSGVPGVEEAGGGVVPGEPSRFGLYARRLWDGLLEAEKVASQ